MDPAGAGRILTQRRRGAEARGDLKFEILDFKGAGRSQNIGNTGG
jgi:hypothetical protein